MKKEQFEILIEKLEEIRCGLIDVETNTEDHCNCEVEHNKRKIGYDVNGAIITPDTNFSAERHQDYWICPAHGYKHL